jgi:hypothetical protein
MKFPFFSNDKWDIERVNPPWGARTSIYQHILANLRPGEPGLTEAGEILPDDQIVTGGKQIRWAPGALDGVFSHHQVGSDATETANKVLESFRALTKKATGERASSLYSLLLEHNTLSYVDQLLEAAVAHRELNAERIHAIARWLASRAADREPLKCAIGLLGICRRSEDHELLLTLGRHEEFTLFVSVALTNSVDEPELSVWTLARLVTSWGRIQIIERSLSQTKDEQIKAWLLREGYKNDVLYEYTALVCAETGELLPALASAEPDDKLLTGAGSILAALIRGREGPAAGIDEYKDGPEATELYLSHLQKRDVDLQGLIDVSTIEEFLKEEVPDTWVERKSTLLALTNAIRSRPGLEQEVRDGLNGEDRQIFWSATEAARLLSIDVWDIYFERLERGEDLWFHVSRTDDNDRFDRVIAFAEETLPLQEIASGPSDSIGMDPEFKHHNALDSVLQELRRFPGKGWSLIRAGLQSPTVRNRNMSVQALSTWPRTTWPADAEQLLRDAIAAEPDDRTRAAMVKALEGGSS